MFTNRYLRTIEAATVLLTASLGLFAPSSHASECSDAKFPFDPDQTVLQETVLTWEPSFCWAVALQAYQDGQLVADGFAGASSGSLTIRDLLGGLDGRVELKLWMGDPAPAHAVFV